MDFQHKKAHSLNNKVLVLVVAGILILVNVLSLRFFVRFDWTRNQNYSISDSTTKILQNLDDIVTVKAYFSDDLPPQFLPVRQYLSDLLSEYKAYSKGNFDYQFVDPDGNQDALQEAMGVGVRQVRLQVMENDSLQVKNGYMGLALFYQGEGEGIPVIQQDSLDTLEYDLTSTIFRLSQPRKQVIGFLTGHGERELADVQRLQSQPAGPQLSLLNTVLSQTYTVQEVSFSDGDTLEGIDVLIVAGPRRDLTDRDIFEVDQYLLGGGNVIFLIDSLEGVLGSVDLRPLETNLPSLLEPLGVKVETNLLLDRLSELTNFSEGEGSFYILQYPPFIRLVANNFSDNPIVAKIQSMVIRNVSSLTLPESHSSLQFDAFLNTSPEAWTAVPPFQLDPKNIQVPKDTSLQQYSIAAYITGLFPRLSSAVDTIPKLQRWEEKNPGEFELVDVFPDPNRVDRNILTEAQQEGRLIVVTDSDFVTDIAVRTDQTPLVIFQNMVDFLASGDALIQIRSKALGGATLTPLTDAEKTVIRFVGILAVPLLFSFYGFIRLWRRRKEEGRIKL